MNIRIRAGKRGDAGDIAGIIAAAFRPVALHFGLTKENCATHPSFYTPEKVAADLEKGLSYSVAEFGGKPVGCVAMEQANEGTCYLERLAVSPAAQRQGIGRALVEEVFVAAAGRGAEDVGIAIIAEHLALLRWYENIGFVGTEKKSFPHLPFTVMFLTYRLSAS